MPHFIAKDSALKFPFSEGDFTFCEEFIDEKYPTQSLILTRYKNQVFFIKKTPRAHGILFKAEKNSRPSLTGILKDALFCLAKSHTLITHNLSHNTPKQMSKSPYLLDAHEVLGLRLEDFVLEIGFGSGRHLLDLARKNPQTLFLGIEIHTPSIEQVLRQIELLGLSNLYITRLDARILATILPSNSCKQIYLHFPVPWNKKPHRRVLSPTFLTHAMRILAPQATLHLRTDDEEYFTDALTLALSTLHASFSVNKNLSQEVISKYEARWLKQEKNIYDLHFKSLESSPKLELNHDFTLPYFPHTPAIPQKTLEKDFFIHLNARFHAKNSIILNISFGDFNWPNTKFILINHQDQTTTFLGEPPLATPANIKAHQRLVHYITSTGE